MSTKQPGVSFVMPVYNEEAIIKQSVTDLLGYLDQIIPNYEVILVENGSTDQTIPILAELKKSRDPLTVLHNKDADFNQAVYRGINEAQNRWVILIQADFWGQDFIQKAYDTITDPDQNPSLIQGTRFADSARDDRPWWRQEISSGFNTALYCLFGYPGTDTHANKVLDTKRLDTIIEQCVLTQNGGLIETEINIRANRDGFAIKEIPQTIQEVRPSRFNMIRTTISDIGELLYLFYLIHIEN